jgi:hypothetical protein
MVRERGFRLIRVSVVLGLLAVAGAARAQVDMMQAVYDGLADNIRKEYQLHVNQAVRQLIVSNGPMAKIEPVKQRLKLLSYNKAVLIASCIADADKERAPDAPAVPLRQNLMITTCVDIKLKQMQKFSDRAAYADFFFPERIESCGESSRLPDVEKVFRPYTFLELADAKLFDFVRYTECLMTR